jgi:hypothetical protein
MVSEQGIVKKVTKNSAHIKIVKSSSCNHGNFNGSLSAPEKNMAVEVKNSLNAKEGTFIMPSFMIYIFPVVALMIGVFPGSFHSTLLYTDPSIKAVFTGTIFLIASLIVLKIIDINKNTRGKHYPCMIRIVACETTLGYCHNI